MAVVYACLVVRSYFQAAVEEDLAYAGVMQSRAMLCEILAMKLLSHFASNHIQLVAVLTTCWNPLAGAPREVVEEIRQALGNDDDEMNAPQSALEVCLLWVIRGTVLTLPTRWQYLHRRRSSSPLPSRRKLSTTFFLAEWCSPHLVIGLFWLTTISPVPSRSMTRGTLHS